MDEHRRSHLSVKSGVSGVSECSKSTDLLTEEENKTGESDLQGRMQFLRSFAFFEVSTFGG